MNCPRCGGVLSRVSYIKNENFKCKSCRMKWLIVGCGGF